MKYMRKTAARHTVVKQNKFLVIPKMPVTIIKLIFVVCLTTEVGGSTDP
jgi:hypothetical protein